MTKLFWNRTPWNKYLPLYLPNCIANLNFTPSKFNICLDSSHFPCLYVWKKSIAVCCFWWSKTCCWLVNETLQVTVEEKAYHKSCFKCSHGGCAITPSNYAALEGILYCKHHFSQLFKEKGSYNHLIKCASVKRAAEAQPEQPAQPAADSSWLCHLEGERVWKPPIFT
jgi:hypothetical protein